MKARNIITTILCIIIVLNMLMMLALKPFNVYFHSLPFLWGIFYAVIICGWPALILIPFAIILLPIAAIPGKRKAFRDRYMSITSYTFLVVSVLILIVNTSMVISKYVFGHKIFDQKSYAEIAGTDANTDDIRNGHFRGEFSYISRQDSVQLETNIKTGQITEFSVKWISASEYRLIRRRGNNYGMNDTLFVRITANLPDRYDCYLKYGDYAQPAVVYKE